MGLVRASMAKHRLQVFVQAAAMWVPRVYPSGRYVVDRDAVFVHVQTLSTIFTGFILVALLARLLFQIKDVSTLEFVASCCGSLLLLFGIDRASTNLSVALQWCAFTNRSTPKTVLLHAEPCNQHMAHLVKHVSRLESRFWFGVLLVHSSASWHKIIREQHSGAAMSSRDETQADVQPTASGLRCYVGDYDESYLHTAKREGREVESPLPLRLEAFFRHAYFEAGGRVLGSLVPRGAQPEGGDSRGAERSA